MGNREIQEAVQQLAGTHLSDRVFFVTATVTAVDIESRSCDCTPISGQAVTDLTGVQLMAEVDDGMLIVPSLGSTVIVCYSNRNAPYIALFSQLDSILMVTLKGIVLQGSELGGLVIAPAVLAKLNLLENAFNLLNQKVNALAPTPVLPPLTVTQRIEIENKSVKHGS